MVKDSFIKFVCIFYLFPLSVAFLYELNEPFGPMAFDTFFLAFLIIVIFTCVTMMFYVIFSKVSFNLTILSAIAGVFCSRTFVITATFLFLIIKVRMVIMYGFDLRQAGEQLSSLGGGAFLQEALRPVLLLASLYRCCKGEDYWICVLIGVTLGVTATGFFDVFFAAVSIGFPLFLRSLSRGTSLWGYYLLLPVFLVALMSVGFLNKISSDGILSHFSDGTLFAYVAEYLFYRLNIWSGSFTYYLNNNYLFSGFNTELINLYFDNFIYRLSQLYPIVEVERPSITNASRLNFLNIFDWDRDSEPGASPGPLAYFLMLPFPVISFFLVSGYCGLILRLLSVVVNPINNLISGRTIIQLVLIPYLLMFILVPFDAFLMIGSSMVALFYLSLITHLE